MPVSFEIRRPPNRRARRAAKVAKAIPGTADCCPKCKSPRVHIHADHGIKFYGRQIAICASCRTAWEPIDETLIWDRSDPIASLSAPCDNCAFRPRSPEQADTAKWKELIAQLHAGGTFHCHKGVPIAPESEDGFAYPKDRPEKLRLCRGYLRGFEEAKNQGTVAFEGLKAMVRSTMQSFAMSFDGNVRGETIEFETESSQSGSPASIPAPAPTHRPVVPTAARPSSPAAGGAGNLPGPQQRILNSLATWAQTGEHQPNNAQVAWLAGYSPSSTSYTNPRSALKTAGLIDYPAKDQLSITADGTATAKPFTLNGSLLEFVLSLLPGPEARILRSIADHYPKTISNDEAATGANYSASSTSYTNPRSALRTKDLITYPVKDQVRAADWLFAQ